MPPKSIIRRPKTCRSYYVQLQSENVPAWGKQPSTSSEIVWHLIFSEIFSYPKFDARSFGQCRCFTHIGPTPNDRSTHAFAVKPALVARRLAFKGTREPDGLKCSLVRRTIADKSVRAFQSPDPVSVGLVKLHPICATRR